MRCVDCDECVWLLQHHGLLNSVFHQRCFVLWRFLSEYTLKLSLLNLRLLLFKFLIFSTFAPFKKASRKYNSK